MEGILLKLKHKFFVLLLIFSQTAYAINVIVAKESIGYKEKIDANKLTFMQVDKIKKKCKPVTLNYLNAKQYIAAHHINRGSIVCEHNLTTYKKNAVLFDFGSIEIERNGKVINENDEYIMLKNEDGKREKIYKDGRTQ